MATATRPAPVQLIKSNHTAVTADGWRLHVVRTCQEHGGTAKDSIAARTFPIILVPGLCSSGAFTFDLSPACSLVDWLAEKGWDVWTVELRGNGLSDKPALLSKRKHWWTVDDMVELDLPAAITYVCVTTACSAAHVLGHSMGGMILLAALARRDDTAARIRSATIVGSSCFLRGSWWQPARSLMGATRLLHSIPAGATLRAYSSLAFTRLGIRAVDVLYFWPWNTDPALARAVLARNFSATSPGVITQFATAFGQAGLRSARGDRRPFADPEVLAAVTTPTFLVCGDKDKMCPPEGAAKQYALLTGCEDKRLAILGPKAGLRHHVGHFDILMGKHVAEEVFPMLHAWFESHDMVCAPDTIKATNLVGTNATAPVARSTPAARAQLLTAPCASAEWATPMLHSRM